jgi:hypothetical protein
MTARLAVARGKSHGVAKFNRPGTEGSWIQWAHGITYFMAWRGVAWRSPLCCPNCGQEKLRAFWFWECRTNASLRNSEDLAVALQIDSWPCF